MSKFKLKKSKDKIEFHEDYVLFKNISKLPPLIYSSTAPTHEISTLKINPYTFFRRAGIIPYTYYEGEIIFFFNIFSGSDRDKKIDQELSDFGGKVEKGENFIQGACNEALEESLGIFNFVNKTNEIASISTALFTTDRSYIILLVPIIIHSNPQDLIDLFQERMEKVQDLNTVDMRKFLTNIKGFKLPELDIGTTPVEDWYPEKAKIKREMKFNPDESQALIFVNGTDLSSLIDGKDVEIADDIYYPQLYFAIRDRLVASQTLHDLL